MQGFTFCPLVADTKQYPAFVGHKPGRNNTQRHKLDIQLIMIMNRTLYIAARCVIMLFGPISVCFIQAQKKTHKKICC